MDGIWQETDHRSVESPEARREWALHAHDVLEEIARRYGRSIAYADLAAEVQRRAGIRTDMAFASWVDDVLDAVDERCKDSGEPQLIALVDRPGEAGRAGLSAARWECHQAYGAKTPAAGASGGSSRARGARSPTTAKARKPPKPPERVLPVCPRCFVELPSTGICDTCD